MSTSPDSTHNPPPPPEETVTPPPPPAVVSHIDQAYEEMLAFCREKRIPWDPIPTNLTPRQTLVLKYDLVTTLRRAYALTLMVWKAKVPPTPQAKQYRAADLREGYTIISAPEWLQDLADLPPAEQDHTADQSKGGAAIYSGPSFVEMQNRTPRQEAPTQGSMRETISGRIVTHQKAAHTPAEQEGILADLPQAEDGENTPTGSPVGETEAAGGSVGAESGIAGEAGKTCPPAPEGKKAGLTVLWDKSLTRFVTEKGEELTLSMRWMAGSRTPLVTWRKNGVEIPADAAFDGGEENRPDGPLGVGAESPTGGNAADGPVPGEEGTRDGAVKAGLAARWKAGMAVLWGWGKK